MTDGNRVYPVSEGFIHHSTGPEFNGGESALEVQDWFSNVGKSRGYTVNGVVLNSYHEHPGRPGELSYAMAHWCLRHNVNDTGNGYNGWELVELIKDPWEQVGWSVGNWPHNQKSVSIEVAGNYIGRSLPQEALQRIADNFRDHDAQIGGIFTVWAHMWVYATQCPAGLVNQIEAIVNLLNTTKVAAPSGPATVHVDAPIPVADVVEVSGTATVLSAAHVRVAPSVSADINSAFTTDGVLQPGDTFAVTGEKTGDDPYGDGRNIWFRSSHNNWVWGGNLSFKATEVPVETPAPAIPVITEVPAIPVVVEAATEPVVEPAKPEVVNETPAIAEVPVNSRGELQDIGRIAWLKPAYNELTREHAGAPVIDLAVGKAIEVVPMEAKVPFVKYQTVNGVNYFKTQNMIDNNLDYGIDGLNLQQAEQPTLVLDSVQAAAATPESAQPDQYVEDVLEGVGKIWRTILNFLDKHHPNNKEKS